MAIIYQTSLFLLAVFDIRYIPRENQLLLFCGSSKNYLINFLQCGFCLAGLFKVPSSYRHRKFFSCSLLPLSSLSFTKVITMKMHKEKKRLTHKVENKVWCFDSQSWIPILWIIWACWKWHWVMMQFFSFSFWNMQAIIISWCSNSCRFTIHFITYSIELHVFAPQVFNVVQLPNVCHGSDIQCHGHSSNCICLLYILLLEVELNINRSEYWSFLASTCLYGPNLPLKWLS